MINKIETPEGFSLVRYATDKHYPFTYRKLFFRYSGRLFCAEFKDTKDNLDKFRDPDTAVSVFLPDEGTFCSFIKKYYIDNMAGWQYDGKETDEDLILHYFDTCLEAVQDFY